VTGIREEARRADCANTGGKPGPFRRVTITQPTAIAGVDLVRTAAMVATVNTATSTKH